MIQKIKLTGFMLIHEGTWHLKMSGLTADVSQLIVETPSNIPDIPETHRTFFIKIKLGCKSVQRFCFSLTKFMENVSTNVKNIQDAAIKKMKGTSIYSE